MPGSPYGEAALIHTCLLLPSPGYGLRAADSWTGELDDPSDGELKLQAEVDTL